MKKVAIQDNLNGGTSFYRMTTIFGPGDPAGRQDLHVHRDDRGNPESRSAGCRLRSCLVEIAFAKGWEIDGAAAPLMSLSARRSPIGY